MPKEFSLKTRYERLCEKLDNTMTIMLYLRERERSRERETEKVDLEGGKSIMMAAYACIFTKLNQTPFNFSTIRNHHHLQSLAILNTFIPFA